MIFVQVRNKPSLYILTLSLEPTMLTIHFVAVEPDRREWGAWNFVAFWIADSANIVCVLLFQSYQSLLVEFRHLDRLLTIPPAEHMDDIFFDDRFWPVLVAVVDLCLGWILHLWLFYLRDRSNRRQVSHLVSCRVESVLRHLGFPVACFQSSGHGGESILLLLSIMSIICGCHD